MANKNISVHVFWMVLLALVVGFTAANLPTNAAMIYVDVANTNGTEDGTQAHPYSTISRGISDANDGDTVYVAPGLYYGGFSIHDSINVQGAGASRTVIDGENAYGIIYVETTGGNDSVNATIEGFTIRNFSNTGIWCKTNVDVTIKNNIIQYGSIAIRSDHSKTIIIQNNIITDVYTGVAVYEGSATLKNNVITKSTQATDNSVTSINNTYFQTGNIDGGWQKNDIVTSNSTGFIDAEHYIFWLTSNSQYKNTGDDDPSYNDPDESRNDRGAYGGPYAQYWGDVTSPSVTTQFFPAYYDTDDKYKHKAVVRLLADEISTIFYTTDGTLPTTESGFALSPIDIELTQTTEIKFFAIDMKGNQSAIQAKTFVVADTNGSSYLKQWNSATNMPTGRACHDSLVYNTYLYLLGGYAGGGHAYDVYVADIRPNGTIHNWRTTSPPPGHDDQRAIAHNGYIYAVLTFNMGNPSLSNKAYSAVIQNDGSLDPWTYINNLPDSRVAYSVVSYGEYMYFVGGTGSRWDSSDGYIYYAKMNSNGIIGTWTQATDSPVTQTGWSSVARSELVAIWNGYLYIIKDSGIKYMPINSDGTLGTLRQSVCPYFPDYAAVAVIGNRLVVTGGTRNNISCSTVYSALLNSDGSIGTWIEDTPLPSKISKHSAVTTNYCTIITGGEEAEMMGYLDSAYIYPIPNITSISPVHGPSTGGTTVTITGNNFDLGATVLFAGIDATSITVDSDMQITAITPANSYGLVDVTVVNSDGVDGKLINGFTYNQIYPDVDSPKMNGSEFWVDIACHQENLFNISFKLNYTTSVLNAVETEITDALGNDLVSYYNVNETAGYVDVGISRKAGAGNTNIANSVTRVKFAANAQQETDVTFSFSDIHAYHADGTPINVYGDSVNVTISVIGAVPTALASDITNVPTVMYQDMNYSISSKYSDQNGYDDLNYLWLTFDNGEDDITLQAQAGATATNQAATVTQGSSYVTNATYDRSSSGTDTTVTWYFTLNDTWTESTGIDLIVQCRDDENNASQADTLDANIDYVIDKTAPTNVGLNTPANNATDVPVDTVLTILTAADSAVGLADQPYWIEVATDTNFTENFQDSDWIDSTSWTPSTTLTPGTVYYWRVKAKDKIGNESLYCGHTADTEGYGTFTAHNSTPTALASDITGVPTVIFQDKSYTITSKYSDADGYADLDELWLTFDNGDNDIVFKAEDGDSGTSIQTIIESGYDYVTSATYDRTSSGNDITINWTFTLNNSWIESSAIDLIIKCDDKHDAASTPDTLDANITYDNDVEPPTNVGLSTPANNASAVHTDSTLTVLTATDAGVGLADQPYFTQLATNAEFTEGVQESGWISSTTFDPDLLPATTYYWRLKSKDQYGNESEYCGHTADTAGYGTFSTAYYVWPGDLNNNGAVNEEDLHPLGQYWDSTGPARARFYQLWNGEPAEPWDTPEMTYVDGNGTGVIDSADVLPIGFNWAKTHQVPPQPQVILVATESSPPLTVVAPKVVKPGDKFTVSVKLGDDTRSVDDLFGVSFALQYTVGDDFNPVPHSVGDREPTPHSVPQFIKPTEVQEQKLIGEHPLHVVKIDAENGVIGYGVTRKAGQGGVDKNGIVAKIDFKVSGKTPLGTPIDLSIIRTTVKTAGGKRIPVNINSAAFVVGYLGDVTLDSKINQEDVVPIFRHIVGTEEFTRGQQMLADVSGDGTVSAYDVSLILQQLAGIIDRFPQDTGQ